MGLFLGLFLVVSIGVGIAFVMGTITFNEVSEVFALTICLFWLFLITKYPWNLYFRAKATYDEVLEAKNQNKDASHIKPSEVEELKSMKRRFLFSSISTHIFSSLILYGVLYYDLAGELIDRNFVWLFACSSFIRPAYEFISYLQYLIFSIHEKIRESKRKYQASNKDKNTIDQLDQRIPSLSRGVQSLFSFLEKQKGDEKNKLEQLEKRNTAFKTKVQQRTSGINVNIQNLVTKLQKASKNWSLDEKTLETINQLSAFQTGALEKES